MILEVCLWVILGFCGEKKRILFLFLGGGRAAKTANIKLLDCLCLVDIIISPNVFPRSTKYNYIRIASKCQGNIKRDRLFFDNIFTSTAILAG